MLGTMLATGPKIAKGVSSTALRARVLANINESTTARLSSKFNEYAGFAKAYSFYRNQGWSADRTLAHMKGIDFSKSVKSMLVPRGTILVQHTYPVIRSAITSLIPERQQRGLAFIRVDVLSDWSNLWMTCPP